jgi:hypothetical protein
MNILWRLSESKARINDPRCVLGPGDRLARPVCPPLGDIADRRFAPKFARAVCWATSSQTRIYIFIFD